VSSPVPATLRSIPHDNRKSGELKHFHIVMVVTYGHDLFPTNAAMFGPALQRVTFRTPSVQYIDHGEIAGWILRS